MLTGGFVRRYVARWHPIVHHPFLVGAVVTTAAVVSLVAQLAPCRGFHFASCARTKKLQLHRHSLALGISQYPYLACVPNHGR